MIILLVACALLTLFIATGLVFAIWNPHHIATPPLFVFEIIAFGLGWMMTADYYLFRVLRAEDGN